MRLVETTSRIRFHGLQFWFLRLLELANSFWVCWTWNACAAAFVLLEVILMHAWAAAAFVDPHALVSVFGVCLVTTTPCHEYEGSQSFSSLVPAWCLLIHSLFVHSLVRRWWCGGG